MIKFEGSNSNERNLASAYKFAFGGDINHVIHNSIYFDV